jgi:hypothetical protein
VELDQPLRQRQPHAGAFVGVGIVSRGLARLAEGLEDDGLILLRDPDARVDDGDLDAIRRALCADRDGTALPRVLEGVREQVVEDLPQAALVCDDPSELGRPIVAELDALQLRSLLEGHRGVLEGGGELEGSESQLETVGLDLREIEDVVDEREQVVPRTVDVVDVLGLLLREVPEHPLAQDLREADDGVERRSKLVGHVREERRLVAVGRHGLVARARERLA